MSAVRSPRTGAVLHRENAHALRSVDGDERWPVVEGIPYLRLGSEALASEVLRALDLGDDDAALLLLLPENDAWWDGAPPAPSDLRLLLAERDRLTLRAAMDLLGWGRVGTYFAHRWSDPTYIGGLALLDAHWSAPATAFELACGIGHYLRALGGHGVRCLGADVVFAKLWVARHWVAPDAELVCFDAEAPWPIAPAVDLAFCHDAFYFFRDKHGVAARLKATAPMVALSHVHNRDHANFSAAEAMSADALRALFPGAQLYADEALTAAAAASTTPDKGDLAATEAFGLVVGGGPLRSTGHLTLPRPGVEIRRNPLIGSDWPSDRYRNEYAARATFGRDAVVPPVTRMAPHLAGAAARRDLVELPERW